MAISSDETADASYAKRRNDGETTIKAVHNVALADANSKQRPSLLTRRMLMVCSNMLPGYETN